MQASQVFLLENLFFKCIYFLKKFQFGHKLLLQGSNGYYCLLAESALTYLQLKYKFLYATETIRWLRNPFPLWRRKWERRKCVTGSHSRLKFPKALELSSATHKEPCFGKIYWDLMLPCFWHLHSCNFHMLMVIPVL